MSNPNEVPQPQQPGAQPQPGSVPPAGYQPPQGSEPPQGYQPPPGQPAYQQPAQSAQPAGGFRFEMPTDRPKSFSDVMPKGGFSGMFNVTGMPTELKVSYWIWLIGGFLGVLFGIIGLFSSIVLLTLAPGLGAVILILVLIAVVLAAAQIILAMKMKEGQEWARMALTILAGVSLLLTIISAASVGGQGGNYFGFIVSLAAAVLMWLPNSQNWFKSVKGAV